MTDEREYRQDDLPDRGWCPACGQPVTTVFVDASGWCPDHGRVWVNWNPPARIVDGYDGQRRVGHMHGPVWAPPAVDPKSGKEHAS